MSKRKALSNGQKGLTAKQRQELGFTDKLNGIAARFREDGYYMKGYRSSEIKKQQLTNINHQIAEAEAF
ncbi:MAG: hypothetical protein PHE89_06575 [Alphaproteobacteria bacterium]|nr:hypothetical protein [Alphaproteobacteria bacterium]